MASPKITLALTPARQALLPGVADSETLDALLAERARDAADLELLYWVFERAKDVINDASVLAQPDYDLLNKLEAKFKHELGTESEETETEE